MVLPSASDAAAWLLETARAALAADGRLDLDTALALWSLAPGHPVVSQAIERLERVEPGPGGRLAAWAIEVSASIKLALQAGDDDAVRQVVSDFETELLGVFRPGRSLGTFEADVRLASLLLDIWDIGRQQPHQMMAEELMLIAVRCYWPTRHSAALPVRAEAARTLARLHHSTAKAEYREYAVALLQDVGGTYRQYGLNAARYVLALQAIS